MTAGSDCRPTSLGTSNQSNSGSTDETQRTLSGSVTPSMERGAIDAGLHGDKVVGFDPATAPMETDAEAGGTPTQPNESKIVSPGVEPGHNGTAYGTAMKPLQPKRRANHRNLLGIPLIVVAVLLVVLLFLLA